MTREEIIGMAREADPFGEHGRLFELAQLTPDTLERFAALVAAKERQACSDLCEGADVAKELWCGVVIDDGYTTKRNIAAAIRARGDK